MNEIAHEVEGLFRLLDSPLYLATTSFEGRDNAWIINYATRFSLSADPVYMLVCVSHENLSHEMVERSGVMALHLLRKDQWPWIRHFGRQSARDTNKLDGVVEVERRVTGSPVITDSVACLDTRVVETVGHMDVGDHTCHLVEVVAWELFDPNPGPLLSVHDAYAHGFA